MALNKSYNQIVDIFEELSTKHYQINGFINNHPLEINSSNLKFPIFCIYPGTNSMSKNGTVNYGIKFFVMDLLDSDYSNEREIVSDCEQIGLDFIAELDEKYDEYGLFINTEDTVWQKFAENFESSEDTDISDDVGGCFFDITLSIKNSLNSCISPFKPQVTPEPETKYYIETPIDIYGYSMVIRINGSNESPSYTSIELDAIPSNLFVDDMIYVGYSTYNNTKLILDGYTVIDIVDKTVDIDYNLFKTNQYQRFAKLTPFTQATYGTQHMMEQGDNTLVIQEDLIAELRVDDKIRITIGSVVYYDIIQSTNFKGGTFSLIGYMVYYAQQGETVIVEKMTDIV